MFEASAELFSSAGSYLKRLSGMVFRPGHTGKKIADEVSERLDGKTEKHHAARFFYSTLAAVVFSTLVARFALLSDDGIPVENQIFQAAYFVLTVFICEVASQVSFTSRSARPIYAALSIHAVALVIIATTVSIFAVGIPLFWLGTLVLPPFLIIGFSALGGLLIAALLTLIFLYRSTREVFQWTRLHASLQALITTVIIYAVFGAGGFLLNNVSGLAN